MNLFHKLNALFRRRDLEADMAEEMRGHLERRTREKIAEGLAPDEARYAAQREFGGLAQVQEQCRDERRWMWLEQSAQDIRYAFRQLRRNPGFAATAIATLALGTGLNTAIFSVAYGVLWRPLPYPEPNRLVMISAAQQTETGPKNLSTWAPMSYAGLRERVAALEQLAAYSSINAQLAGRGEPRQLQALEVSANFFATLGVAPARGRGFFTGAGAPDDDRSAIISDRLWRTSLKADPAIVGQAITLDGAPRTVVGVLPPDFSFRPVVGFGALPEADVFLLNRWPADAGTSAFLFLLGRLKPGVTHRGAEAELSTLASDASIVPAGALTPAGAFAANAQTLARVAGLQEYGAAPTRRLLLVLLAAVAFVQLIACLNVANLQMARLTARRGELSVRLALGAGRRRIVRQLLTEAVVLSLLGTTLAVLLARVALDLTLPLVPPFALPRLGGIVIDARVLGFCLGVSVVSTLLIGFVPALRIGGAAFAESLALHAGAARATGDRQGERLRTLLVAAQIAMTLVLLVGAGLLIHSFVRLTSVSPGFEANGRDGVVQTVKVTLPQYLYDKPERIQAFARGVLERVQHLPGVKSSSLINSAPFGRMFIRDDFEIEGQPKPKILAGKPKIDADYFRTMGIPLLAGRDFTARDTAEAPKVAIVSERIARECFPGSPGEAIGQRVRFDERGEWLTVVGVVADIRQRGLDQEVQPMLYVPFQQEREAFLLRFVAFVARTSAPASVVEGIRAEIRRAAPDLPIETTVTMDEAVAASVAAPRFRMLLLGMFALTATLIATCGIYGLMAYAVTQRRREIGVRMALGAQRGDVLRLVLGRALRIVACGVIVGLAGAAGVTRVLQRFLFGVTSTDPLVFAIVTLVLLAVGLIAAWLPARRAAKVDPMVALRCE
jgi:predicted permease